MSATKRPARLGKRRPGLVDYRERQAATDACRADLAALSTYLDGACDADDRTVATQARWADALALVTAIEK